VNLEGVPETALWSLYHRALASRAGEFPDPRAEALVAELDYPFEARMGGTLAARQGLRVRAFIPAFDREIRRFLADRPDGTVVALGEGCETQFWRVDNGRVNWVTVDLPGSAALREQALGSGERRRIIPGSALDEAWMDQIDPSRGVLITAQGLLMYLEPADVHGLIAALARRFAGQVFIFDAPSVRVAARSGKTLPNGYTPPVWPFGLDTTQRRALRAVPGVASLDTVELPRRRGRGALLDYALPLASRLPGVRDALFSINRVTFAQA
jgi:O-methyltransferase involved in polyketide biosynthesis